MVESGGLENRLSAFFKLNKTNQILLPIIGLHRFPVHLISRLFICLYRSLVSLWCQLDPKYSATQSVTIWSEIQRPEGLSSLAAAARSPIVGGPQRSCYGIFRKPPIPYRSPGNRL